MVGPVLLPGIVTPGLTMMGRIEEPPLPGMMMILPGLRAEAGNTSIPLIAIARSEFLTVIFIVETVRGGTYPRGLRNTSLRLNGFGGKSVPPLGTSPL